jgi:hypothetical protein
MIISDHADERARKRLGISRKAVARMALKAWEKGAPEPYEGHRYTIEKMIQAYPMRSIRAYGGYIWIYGTANDGSDTVLISVVPQTKVNLDNAGNRHQRRHEAKWDRFYKLRKRASERAEA